MLQAVRKALSALFDIRRDELTRVLPLASAYGLILASLYVLKPARNALFLNSIGIEQLPYVLLLVALIGGITSSLFSRVAQSVRIDRLIIITFLVLIAFLIGFRLLIPTGWSWVFYAFYIWVALYGLMATSLLWLLANSVFTSREARRVFGLIGTGGIAGAIIGGVFTGQVVELLGTENLLFVCVGILFVCTILVRMTKPAELGPQRRRRQQEPEPGPVAVYRSALLRNLAITAALIAVIAVVIDIQFNEIIDRAYPDIDAKTAFFGQFFAYLSGFSFLFQLLFTSKVLRSFGVGIAIMILPVAMGLGSLSILLIPGILSAILVKGSDGGFRHSVHKSAAEVLFLPVPAEIKKQSKLFLDTTVDTAATGLGALLVLLLTGPLALSYRYLSIVSIGLTVLIVFVGLRLRRAYVDAFRQALEGQKIDLKELRENVNEAAALGTLLPALKTDNERQLIYVLDLLSSAKSKDLVDPATKLLEHPSAEVRRRALIVLQNQGTPDLIDRFEALIESDEDQGVRLEAMHLVCLSDEKNARTRIERYLDGEDTMTRSAALGCIARAQTAGVHALLSEERVTELLAREEPDAVRAELASALCVVGAPTLKEHLRQLKTDPSPLVIRHLIAGIGRGKLLELVPWLIEKLSDRRFRGYARTSLESFGADVVEVLAQQLEPKNEIDRAMRRYIPRILGGIGAQAAVDLLLSYISDPDPGLRDAVLRALMKLRTGYPELRVERKVSDAALMTEGRAYIERLSILQLEHGDGDGEQLLVRALGERQKQSLGQIFMLLGLRYPPEDMQNAYHGVISNNKAMRASALEFLENILPKELTDYMLPMLERRPTEEIMEMVRGVLDTKTMVSRESALGYLIRGPDAWLRACAVYNVCPEDNGELKTLVERASTDPDPIVRETANKIRTELIQGTA